MRNKKLALNSISALLFQITAVLCGFILRYANEGEELYQKAVQIAELTVETVVGFHLEVNNGTMLSADTFPDLCCQSGDLFIRRDFFC